MGGGAPHHVRVVGLDKELQEGAAGVAHREHGDVRGSFDSVSYGQGGAEVNTA